MCGFRNYLENKYTSNKESIRKIDKRALILLHLKNNPFKNLVSNRDFVYLNGLVSQCVTFLIVLSTKVSHSNPQGEIKYSFNTASEVRLFLRYHFRR